MNQKKKVLFVCVANSCRSQIAEGFTRFYGYRLLDAYSAGSSPSGEIDRDAVEVMQEVGIDISGQSSKGFKNLTERNFDYLITMGCQDQCPFISSRKNVEWDIEDPNGKSMYFFRQVREKIREKVKGLIKAIIAEEAELGQDVLNTI
jgi:arsenate reductase